MVHTDLRSRHHRARGVFSLAPGSGAGSAVRGRRRDAPRRGPRAPRRRV